MTANAVNAKLPVKYSPEVALAICEEIASGKTLVEVCDLDGMPSRNTVYRWLSVYPKFFDAYERAKEVSAQSLEDEALGLARRLSGDNDYTGTKVTALNYAMQQLRWSAAHRDPNRYGERAQTNSMAPIQINTTLNLGQDGKPPDAGEQSVYTVTIDVPEQPVASESMNQWPGETPATDVYTIDLDPTAGDTTGRAFGVPDDDKQDLHNPPRGRPKGTNKGIPGRRKSATATKRAATMLSKKLKGSE